MQKTVRIVGAGPAGLMAAEVLCTAGYKVHVYDTKPSACRKLLVAGIGGLNLTHCEPYPDFIQRYYEKSAWMNAAISQFNADELRAWALGLGVETMVGSSGRVFPADMKAAPLLRSWLKRLRESGVVFHMKHRLVAMQGKQLHFEHKDNTIQVEGDAVILAMGGGSWPKLGSDGAWQAMLSNQGIELRTLEAANCGFLCNWSEHLQTRYAGSPLKNIAFNFTTVDGQTIQRKGECILSEYGLEGSLIYAYSKHLRESINANGKAELTIDLLPDQSTVKLAQKLQAKAQGKNSFSKYLKRTTGVSGAKAALLYECFDRQQLQNQLAARIKSVPITLTKTAPLEDAISTAGGVCEESVNERLMLEQLPGVFCAGEMLDWEAPTGGYLLTACFATGRLAATGVCGYLEDL